MERGGLVPAPLSAFLECLNIAPISDHSVGLSAPETRPVVGRLSELAVLHDILDRVTIDPPSAALIIGEAGIGKTRLLDELQTWAGAAGVQVIRGRPDVLSRHEALGSLVDAVARPQQDDRTSRAVSRLLAALGLPGRRPAIEAFLEVIEAAAAAAPVLMMVDDLQWTDPSTVQVLRSAIRRLTTIPLGVVAATRPAATIELEALRATVETSGGRILTLAPLDRDSVKTLAERTLGAPPGESLLRRLEATGGIPLWVCELMDALATEGRIRTPAGLAEVETLGLPASLQTTILDRLSHLAPRTVEVLKSASLFGGAFTIEELAVVRDEGLRRLLTPLQEALDARILTEAGEAIAFRHDLIREAVYSDMPLSLRRALHRDAARVLRNAGAPPGRVAAHLAVGALPGDEEAVSWLQEAAREAVRQRPSEAADHLKKVFAITSATSPERHERLIELLDALVFGGHPDEAAQVAEDELPTAETPAARVDIQLRLGSARYILFQLDRATHAFSDVLALMKPQDPRRPLILAEAGFCRVVPDPVAARELALEAIRTSSGDHATEGVAQMVLAGVDYRSGYLTEAIARSRTAVALAERWHPPDLVRRSPHMYLALMLLEIDEFDEADLHLRPHEAQREKLASHSLWHVSLRRMTAGFGLYYRGEWPDAAAELETGIAMAEETGTIVGVDSARAMLALMAHDQGADELASFHMQAIPAGSIYWRDLPAVVLEAERDPELGLRRLRSIADFEPSRPTADRLGLPRLIRLCVKRAARPEARRLVDHVEEGARRSSDLGRRALALQLRSLLENDIDGLIECVALHRDHPRVAELAGALHDAAVALARARRRKEAMDHSQEADVIYDRLGAVRLSMQLRSDLEAAGLVRQTRQRGTKPRSGWESLTKTELRVARHVADGLTNREIAEQLFLSRRTIETHVGHILQKLGMRTRAQLVAAAARRYSASDALPRS